jgi:L-amino acid N-acyltransferase YncA
MNKNNKTSHSFELRYATEEDLPRIVEIYNASIPGRRATADLEPVTVASRRDWFSRHDPDRRPILVCEIDGDVAAWVSFESFYGRPAFRNTAEISIYMAPGFQGKGLGRQILEQALERAQQAGIKTLLGYVFSHNEPSLKLFRSFGFEEWGRFPDIAEMDGKTYSLSILGKKWEPFHA